MNSLFRKFLSLNVVFYSLYIFGLIIAVPLSLLVWFIRRELFVERSVAGGQDTCSSSSFTQQWNGGSDRCTVALIKHFTQGGHRVVWLTTMIDEYWANEDFHGVEIREIGLRLHPGDWFSQNIALGYHLVFSDLTPDLVILDHSASCVPMIKWRFPLCKVLFYCHFPQQLVTPARFFLYRWYSKLVGLIEARLYESADVIMVNTKTFMSVMPSVPSNKVQVVYPPCNVDSLSVGMSKAISRGIRVKNDRFIFLSMNRFWPEKRLDIIVEAASILKKQGLKPLIQLAGSVMPHIPESRIYFQQLQSMCKEYDVEEMVEFIISPSEESKFRLYRQCDSTLYTPPNEHFGIVPIEALEQRRPVIVINSGGPAETVIENITGTKIDYPCGKLLANAMIAHMKRETWEHLDNDDLFEKQRIRFLRDFSFEGFGSRIDDAVLSMFPDSYLPMQIHNHVDVSQNDEENVLIISPSQSSKLPQLQKLNSHRNSIRHRA